MSVNRRQGIRDNVLPLQDDNQQPLAVPMHIPMQQMPAQLFNNYMQKKSSDIEFPP